MAEDFRSRTRNLLGLNPLPGAAAPRRRSAYARFTAPGPDTTMVQLLVGAALYAILTVFCIALVFGSAGVFGRVLFAVLTVLGFLFTMQRIVIALNRGDKSSAIGPATESDETRPGPGSSSRTGGPGRAKKGRGGRRSGDPRQSG